MSDTDVIDGYLTAMWIAKAVAAIEAELARAADTHLGRLDLPELGFVQIYFKDESVHPTGSLKHRLARSLFLYGLVNGWIREGRPVIEASSGSTAISEAYFAQLIGIPFIAVLPASTAPRKIAAIGFYGGQVEYVDRATQMEVRARELTVQTGGHFMDQFTFAERATEWRGNNNIAERLFAQMSQERHPVPDWVVVGAGTGGTSATIGRYIRYRSTLCQKTRLCVVDPEGSAYFKAYISKDWSQTGHTSRVVEGIGRPRVEASFLPTVVHRMMTVPDAASVAACLWLEEKLGRRVGPSTGANLIGAFALAAEMGRQGQVGSIATLICDDGERYADTVYQASWRAQEGLVIEPWRKHLEVFARGQGWHGNLTDSRRELLTSEHERSAFCYHI